MYRTQFFDRLLLLAAVLQEDQDRELSKLGLNPRRTQVMWIIHHRGALMQREIAEDMQVTQRHVTTLVDELIDEGLVYREPHPSDRRAVLIRLTEKGMSLMETMASEHVELADALTAGWTDDEVLAMKANIETIVERFTALVDDARQREERRS